MIRKSLSSSSVWDAAAAAAEDVVDAAEAVVACDGGFELWGAELSSGSILIFLRNFFPGGGTVSSAGPEVIEMEKK